ncbi:protein mono-ADP-ribosyltransferase PARP9 [Eublepharis macularius]|uniref:Protein mono-ADP-ribosyltransferase PARP9 n=1 Tax=Eublepharis macularius TaxID=481883 RepID=A0AA97IZZ8_EUBMA|nr:protein mono-ADP-ribosyltransferase PARP9 [Eublepharis macularius]
MDEEILSISISSYVYAILKRRENYLCSLLQKKFGCITILKGVRNPTEVYRKNLKEGVAVSVLLDDLARHEADALVNAANENLHHFGGLAFTLLKAGGPEIEEQCKRFIEKNGRLCAGQIAVTSGGRLPCKQVIHIVGPRWSEDQREECCLRLETAIINILKYVNAPENNIKSVAMPALSSGFFNFPLDLCAQVVVRTIKNFIQLAPLFGYLQEIHLVSTDESTVEVMKKACEELLGVNDIAPLRGASDSITVNNLCLQIKKGNIENQQTAIIINSVIVQDDLSQGTISRAILEKAGSPMQEQFLSELQKHPAEYPKLICTKGYNIACDFVLHMIWPSQNERNTQQALKAAVSKSLLKTQEQQFPSISFPPFGMEDLHLPKDEVADIMVEQIIHFAQEHSGEKPAVYIVIPHDDDDAYKAFCTKVMSITNSLDERMDCSNMDAMEIQTDIQAGASSEKNGPFVELIGRSREALEEAGLWLKNIIQVEDTHQIVIRNYSHLNLGQSQPVELSHLQQHFGITILESLTKQGSALEIEGSPQAVIDATFAIEFMLQNAADQECLKGDGHLGNDPRQEDCTEMTSKYCYQVTPIESYLQEFKDKEKQLEKAGLRVLKIEKIYNPVLESTFQRIKRKIEGKNSGRPVTHRLYHRVPAQYCSLVCKTGFQTTYSSSQDQKYGSGIYFNKNPRNLVADTREKCEMDHLICAFEAEVVTGLYTRGNRSYVVPPLINASGMKLYDSVVDDIHNPETFVIFNREQALPLYLLTCSLIWNPGEKTNLQSSAQKI